METLPAYGLAIHPLRGNTEIVVEQDNQNAGSWYVSLNQPMPLLPTSVNTPPTPVYFPPVKTQEALLDALTKAWEFHRKTMPPTPFLTRFLES